MLPVWLATGLPHAPLTTSYFLLTTHYSPLTTHHSLLTTHHSPLTTHHSPLTSHDSLLAAHHSPLTTHYSLLTTHYALLFPQAAYSVVATSKDNTGRRRYTEGMVFPTLQFPSDHGLVATVLREV